MKNQTAPVTETNKVVVVSAVGCGAIHPTVFTSESNIGLEKAGETSQYSSLSNFDSSASYFPAFAAITTIFGYFYFGPKRDGTLRRDTVEPAVTGSYMESLLSLTPLNVIYSIFGTIIASIPVLAAFYWKAEKAVYNRQDNHSVGTRERRVPEMAKKTKKKEKVFNWENTRFRHFLLKFAYYGTPYHGVAFQPPTRHPNRPKGQEMIQVPTVESDLLRALELTKLIRSRSECRFSRCGRTDKGVHAAGNYLSLDMRVKEEAIRSGSKRKDRDIDPQFNLDYAAILNAVLPLDIRVIEVTQVPENLDARFSCLFRQYEYYFPSRGMDVEKMNRAAKQFIGTHDFSNFCKMDVANTRDFRRTLLKFDISILPGGDFAVARCEGLSFLWHQVRCMMAILLLIGSGLEEENVIETMLDIEKVPLKPQYELASEDGLILKECLFDRPQEGEGQRGNAPYQKLLMAQMLKMHILRSLNGQGPFDSPSSDVHPPASKSGSSSKYVPLLQRATEKGYADKVENFKAAGLRKKAKLEADAARDL